MWKKAFQMSERIDPNEALQLWHDQNWEELFVKIAPLIRGVVLKKKFPILDVDDAHQDACLKVYRRLQDNFNPEKGNIIAYVIQVASHATYTHCTKQTSQTHMFQTEQIDERFDAPVSDDDQTGAEDFIHVMELVGQKSCRNRKKVLNQMIRAFREYGPLDQIELAKMVDMNHANINKMLGIVKRKYRKSLNVI